MFCTWTFSDGSGDFVATAPSSLVPSASPVTRVLPVATPLSSSCHRGSLGRSYSVKLLPQLAPWSRPLSCGLLRSNSKLPKLYMYCRLLQRMRVVFHNLCLHLSLRHFNRTQHSPEEQLIYKHTSTTCISQVWL